MLIKLTKKQLNNYLLSKYNYVKLKKFPKIESMCFNLILNNKQKNKYYLFLNMILMIIFFNPNTKTRFLFKTSQINILELNFKSEHLILRFLFNFIYIYFPQIDSFTAEFKFFLKKNAIKFSFFKFPFIFELNSLFGSIDYLYSFMNNYKFQLNFILKKQKNHLLNYNVLQYYKLPVQL